MYLKRCASVFYGYPILTLIVKCPMEQVPNEDSSGNPESLDCALGGAGTAVP